MRDVNDAGLAGTEMRLEGPLEQEIIDEFEVIERMLPLDGARILELGCGAAAKTRQIAERTGVAEIVAAEVDAVQHQKNQSVTDLPNVVFRSFGAQKIPEPAASFDAVVMFKSLHHVPVPDMDDALREIARVLKPGGLAYLSEPVFAGDFNEIMRVFHDEEAVRRAAFDAIRRAVDSGQLLLAEEHFFLNVIRLKSWAQYETGILNVTHTEHRLTTEQLAEVKRRFMKHEGPEGFVFRIPNRVDLLRKP